MNHTYINKQINIDTLYDIINDINHVSFNYFFTINFDSNYIYVNFDNKNSLMTIKIDEFGINSRVNSPIYNVYIVYLEFKIMSHIADKLGLHTIQPEGIGADVADVAIQRYINIKYDDILCKKKWYVRLLFNPRKQLKRFLTKEQYKRLLKF